MSLAQRFERRLEGVVGSAFARVFKGQVEPVEIGNALQREASDKHAVMGNGQILAPNRYRVSLGASDHERLAPWEVQLCTSLAELVQEYLDEQDWATVGDIEVILHRDEALHTGVFGVASRMEPEAAPRRRPYDSLSLPVVPGEVPGHYEHPFGSPPPVAGVPPGSYPYGQAAAGYAPSGYGQDPYAPNPYGPQDPYGHADSAAAGAEAPYPPAPFPPAPYPPAPFPPAPFPPAPQAPEYAAQYAQYPPAPAYEEPYAPAYGHPQGQPYGSPGQAPEPRRPQVRGVLAIDGADTHIVLRIGSNVVGRGHDCDLQILDQGVSRRHVDVQFDGEAAVVYDLGSTNGTAVNGQQIGNHQLRHGDVIRVGHTRIVYHQENG